MSLRLNSDLYRSSLSILAGWILRIFRRWWVSGLCRLRLGPFLVSISLASGFVLAWIQRVQFLVNLSSWAGKFTGPLARSRFTRGGGGRLAKRRVLLIESLENRPAPTAPRARTETLTQLAGPTRLLDLNKTNDLAAADVKAEADW